MSFTDKIKTGLKNTDSLAGQKVDEAKYETKIAEQKSQKRKFLSDANDRMFEAYCKGFAVPDEVRDLYEKAKTCDVEVDRLEAEKKDIIAKAKAERESN